MLNKLKLIYIKSINNHQYIVQEMPDTLRNKMQILYGYCYHITAIKRWVQNKKTKEWYKVLTYNTYIAPKPIQICSLKNIVEKRNANRFERNLYFACKNKDKLSAEQRKYILQNALIDMTIGINHNTKHNKKG